MALTIPELGLLPEKHQCQDTVSFSHCCHSHCCRTFFAPMSHRTACNNTPVNSNSREEEEDKDREQRTNTTLKKDVVQTTSTNNSTPITPFYMQLRYSISPVTLPPSLPLNTTLRVTKISL